MAPKSRTVIPLLTAILLLSGHWSPAYPCTTFVLHGGNQLMLGRNLDWHTGTGLILVNPRGLEKTALITREGEQAAKWTANYGSVTFNQVGRELPYGGMNEAGLVVEHMTLDSTVYPPKDERPAVPGCQWIQYQLDNHSTVEEVIRSDGLVRILDARSHMHFLICDRRGHSAVIEFLNGKMVSYAGKDLPVAALANSTYADSLRCLRSGKGADENRSLLNFVTAARRAKQFDLGDTPGTVRYAFDTLNAVGQGLFTKWSIVYDIQNLRVHVKVFETPTLSGENIIFRRQPGQAQVKIVDVKAFDFSCAKPPRALDLDARVEGAVNDKFQEYTVARNRESIAKAFTFLAKRKICPPLSDDAIDGLSKYPESFRCR